MITDTGKMLIDTTIPRWNSVLDQACMEIRLGNLAAIKGPPWGGGRCRWKKQACCPSKFQCDCSVIKSRVTKLKGVQQLGVDYMIEPVKWYQNIVEHM